MKKTLKDKLVGLMVDKVTKQGIFGLLPDKQSVILDYFLTFGKMPNLQQPKTFNEKLQWIKIYGGLEKYTEYVDKHKVRDFVAKTIGSKYLVPLLGVWERFEEIPFEKLPRRFVLKATHGSGYVFVCQDKSSLNKKRLKGAVNRWLRTDFYQKTREIQYRDSQPKIIGEKYLEDESGQLIDYKFLCFGGQAKIIEVIWDRFTKHKNEAFLDFNWKMLNRLDPVYAQSLPPKPQNFKQLAAVAEKLAQEFPFVRVDLYSVRGKIYFGELTFTPDNGLEKYDPPTLDDRLGKLFKLSPFSQKTNVQTTHK